MCFYFNICKINIIDRHFTGQRWRKKTFILKHHKQRVLEAHATLCHFVCDNVCDELYDSKIYEY